MVAAPFVVLGAGRRVIADVLPALRSIEAIDSQRIYVVRRSNRQICEFPKVQTFAAVDELPIEPLRGCVVLSCIPPEQNIDMLPRVIELLRPQAILVDTPIRAIADILTSYEDLYSVQIRILEDSHLIPNLKHVIRDKSWNVVVVWKGLYYYHGAATLRAMAHYNLVQVLPWWLTRYNVFAFLDSTRNCYFMLGSKNSSRARMLSAHVSRKGVGWRSTDLHWGAAPSAASRADLVEEQVKNVILDSKSIKDIDSLKRIGLTIGLERLLAGDSGAFMNVREALINEELVRSTLDSDETARGSRKVARVVRDLATSFRAWR